MALGTGVVALLGVFLWRGMGFIARQNALLEEQKGRLEAVVAELEAASRLKSEFLASMSHELRTPLNAILGFAQVLQKQYYGPLNEKQGTYVDYILNAGRHLLDLINEVLDLSKIEAGRLELDLTAVRLPDLIRNALVMVRERALRHGIELSVAASDDLPDIRADERRPCWSPWATGW